jgi:integration host factor subunit beta
MIKSELVQHILANGPHLHRMRTHLYPRDAERIVNAILDEIVAALARGDRVELRGFGVFSVRDLPARITCNPRSGAVVSVARRRKPLFKTGKEMLDRLNSEKKEAGQRHRSIGESERASRVGDRKPAPTVEKRHSRGSTLDTDQESNLGADWGGSVRRT